MDGFFVRNTGLIAGGAGGAALLAGVIIVGAPFWAGVIVGAAIFGGVYMLGSYWIDLSVNRQAASMSTGAILQRIMTNLQKVQAIRQLADSIPEKDVRDQIHRICDMATRIFHNFQQDPGDIDKASRFLLYLDRFLPLIEKYARLSSTPAGRDLLQQSGDDAEFREVLKTVEQGFTQGFQNYLANDVVELRTYGRVLKKMMHVAEIGN